MKDGSNTCYNTDPLRDEENRSNMWAEPDDPKTNDEHKHLKGIDWRKKDCICIWKI